MHEGRARDLWTHTSSVLALIANVNRDTKRRKPFSPDDFNPYAERRRGRSAGMPITTDNIALLKKAFVRKR